MFATRREALVFIGRTLLWLPVTFALWFGATPFLDAVAARLSTMPVAVASGAKVSTGSGPQGQIRFSMVLRDEYRFGQRSLPPANADIDVNASIYGFGVALFLALSLAHPGTRRFWPVAAGILALALIPAWGVTFDALKQLAQTPELEAYSRFSPTAKEAIVLGYQVGALLLPTVAPVALWFGLNPKLLTA